MLGAISVVAFSFVARSSHELLEPLLGLPEGQAAYAAALRRSALTIALFDLPLVFVVGIASYVLARFSVRPLVVARQREEQFAADAAHELRTPLATIAALAQATRSADAADQTAAFARIAAVALEASSLLGDLLTLMREAPDDPRLHEPVDLAALLCAVAATVESSAHQVSIDVDVPKSGAYVTGDERALRQLIGNLLQNALRHARSRVSAAVTAEQRSVVFQIEDDGPGVPLAARERIFERFYKADPSSPGSGLGLAICRHIAVRHGATIEFNGGSRFKARFPSAACDF